MQVRIIICTWNRAETLDRALAQLRELTIPSFVDWEVVVVNNNCTDGTDRVIEQHRQSLPLRRIFEPQHPALD